MDVRATITLNDPTALPSLAAALDASDCTVQPWGPDSLDVAFDWGARAEEELAHAWSEFVFFLITWKHGHPDVTIDLADVHFAPSPRPRTATG